MNLFICFFTQHLLSIDTILQLKCIPMKKCCKCSENSEDSNKKREKMIQKIYLAYIFPILYITKLFHISTRGTNVLFFPNYS